MDKKLQYGDILTILDNNVDLSSLTLTQKREWEKVFRNRLQELAKFQDSESLAITYVFYVLYLIKTRKIRKETEIESLYNQIKINLLDAEHRYLLELKSTGDGTKHRLLYIQIKSFYKIIVYNLAYLEKNLRDNAFDEYSQKALADKVYFLEKQELFEHHYFKFLSYSRLAFSLFLKKHLFVYALLSGMGMVLFWRGLWGAFDLIMIWLYGSETIFTYALAAALGIIILYFLGLFIHQSVLDTEEIDDAHTRQLNKIHELKTINRRINRR